jgi:peptidylprolyl isomerase
MLMSVLRSVLVSLVLAAATILPASAAEYLNLDLKQGRVVIELKPDLAPKHVARIKELAESGFYDGVIFHRVIANFMAQTGDPTGTGRGGSGKKLPPEFTKTPFKRGTVGMARSQSLDSADSQFFICFTSVPTLDGQYTVWGQVVKGMEFVDQIQKGEPPRNPDRIVKMRVATSLE